MKTKKCTISNDKLNGRYYTPADIVKNILDLSGYNGQSILQKHVIDNSCGDGAFLIAIIDRYCQEFLKNSSNLQNLENDLSTYIHGIEIDEHAYKKCIANLDNTIKKYNLNSVSWDIILGDALKTFDFNGKMDFVLGNPPYVRVHNLGTGFNDVKSFSFAQNGMTDMYIVFYELGLKMLNENGVLGYITPSSFFISLAGKCFRSHLINNNLLDKIVDLKHYQVFDATTYSTIAIIKNNRNQQTTDYYQFDPIANKPIFIDTLRKIDFNIEGNFYFAKKQELQELSRILTFKSIENNFKVKNGFATLADDFFIGDFDFDEFTISVIKASTGKKYKCLFPYVKGKLVSYKELTLNTHIKNYFETNKDMLAKRSLESSDNWYGFGRSQGINDVYKCKYSINTLIKTTFDIKLIKCDKGVGIFGGLYILTEINEQELRDMLYCEDFISYISLLGKYKNCGYYTFSSKDLKYYLEYKYAQRNGFNNEQFSIFSNT